MDNSAVLNRTLDAVAHLAEGGSAWGEILRGCCEIVGGDSASFILLDSRQQLATVETWGISDKAVADYVDHYGAMDIVTPMAMGAREGTWLDTAQMFSPSKLARDAYYVDFMCPNRMRQMVTHIVRERPSDHGGLTVQRAHPGDNMRTTFERPEVQRLVGAIARSIAARRSSAQRWIDALQSAFGPSGEAFCVVNPKGTVSHWPAEANRHFAERSGLECRLGQLWHRQQSMREALYAAIARVASTGLHECLRLPGKDGLHGAVDVATAPAMLALGSEKLVLLRLRLMDTARSMLDGDVRATFGLTKAEELVLAALVAGQSPVNYARARGLSVHTVRKQIAIAKEKMGCSRTVDLVITAMKQ